MIGILGLILAILSVIAVIDPRTPLGKKILKISFIKNDQLIKFYPIYKYYLLLLSSIVLAVIAFLFISVYDFYMTQTFVLSTLYLGFISLVLLLLFSLIKGYSLRGDFLKNILKLLKKSSVLLFSFVLILSLLATYFKNDIDSGKTEFIYSTIYSSKTSEHLLKLSDNSAIDFRDRYKNEIKIISNINLINQYKMKYEFEYDLGLRIDTTQKSYSKLINATKKIYNSNTYTDEFNRKIKLILNFSKSIKTKTFHAFPVELQPYFVGHLVISVNTNYFASLAVGSKIHLINLYNNTIKSLGLIGLIITLIVLSLLSLWLTFKLAKYNEQHSTKNKNGVNYFFISVSIFGFFIAILSLI